MYARHPSLPANWQNLSDPFGILVLTQSLEGRAKIVLKVFWSRQRRLKSSDVERLWQSLLLELAFGSVASSRHQRRPRNRCSSDARFLRLPTPSAVELRYH
jgi:hypothetical protein